MCEGSTMAGAFTSLTTTAGTRGARPLAALAVGLLLSGCWSQIGFGPQQRRQNPDEHPCADGVGDLRALRHAGPAPPGCGSASIIHRSNGPPTSPVDTTPKPVRSGH